MIELGPSPADGVRVQVISRAHPGGLWTFDHDWLHAEVVATVGPCPFRCSAFLRAEDFAQVARELGALRRGDCAMAQFWPRDPWVAFTVERRDGAFALSGYARDGGSERVARFAYAVDAERLRRLEDSVCTAAARFPVVGAASTAPADDVED